ncbi:MAG TPA: cytochrome c3 family protein, partial [Candidatus Baltobacteraceae bacterium]|nr:cytochrome c3 family protein [Candidatus Baltobacteraceae bacterium]
MAQIFRRRFNSFARASLAAFVALVFAAGWIVHAVYWSPWTTRETMPLNQPVPFSHKHHVYGLGIDCRYCHTGVEKSAFAGMPPTETCMSCHSQIWKDAPMLAPVRESLAHDEPLHWNRVNDTPDFVFFNHSIHVTKGIGCATCHGQLDQMPLTWQSHTLYMKWCLDCHRTPEKFIRPRNEVFNLNWSATNQLALGKELVKKYDVHTEQLQDCSMCHR